MALKFQQSLVPAQGEIGRASWPDGLELLLNLATRRLRVDHHVGVVVEDDHGEEVVARDPPEDVHATAFGGFEFALNVHAAAAVDDEAEVHGAARPLGARGVTTPDLNHSVEFGDFVIPGGGPLGEDEDLDGSIVHVWSPYEE